MVSFEVESRYVLMGRAVVALAGCAARLSLFPPAACLFVVS